MRVGVTVLPELRWREAEPRWRAVEDLGFDHGWTYDHLVWGGLPQSPWYGTTPTLAAAALVTSRIGLGTFVTSPNFRHPVTLHRDVQSLDDLSGGRFVLAVGAGATDVDARILGLPALSARERADRFHEFVRLAKRLRDEDHVSQEGRWFSADDARTLPRVEHVPIVVAAGGPRGIDLAAEVADGWMTLGRRTDDLEQWYDGLREEGGRLDDRLAAHGRDAASVARYVNLDSSPRFSLESVDLFEEMAGRVADLGFTDAITHWPRAESPYAGAQATLEAVAADVLPRLRG
nr:LLM class flavin-dependent oxidoreductase [Lapillicoccus jejuensis]